MLIPSVSWDTHSERLFIDGLGTGSLAGLRMGRKLLLDIYAQAITRRVKWEHIDRAAIVQHVRRAVEGGLG